MGAQSCMEDALPFVLMAMIELGDVVDMTLNKAAMNAGLSNWVLVVYYNALGTLLLFPFFIFHRHRSKLPPLSFYLLFRISLIGLLGVCLVKIFAFTGISLSSPTLATAISNLIPAFTFLLAIIFRMEKFNYRRQSSQAKSLGTIVAISGALLMTLYEGPALVIRPTSPSNSPHRLLLSQQSNWVLGGLFLGITYLLASTWYMVQTAIVKEYPDEVTVVFFYCLFGTMECAVFSLFAERNPNAWTPQSGIKISAIVFSAIYEAVFRNNALTWCLHKKGPVFVAMFKPLQIVIAVFMGIMFLGDALHLGSVIGGTLISIGFYTVMWGLTKERLGCG